MLLTNFLEQGIQQSSLSDGRTSFRAGSGSAIVLDMSPYLNATTYTASALAGSNTGIDKFVKLLSDDDLHGWHDEHGHAQLHRRLHLRYEEFPLYSTRVALPLPPTSPSLKTACARLSIWSLLPPSLRFSVNPSPAMPSDRDQVLSTRRAFIRQAACAAVGTAALTHTISDLRIINAAMAQTVATDYKALVCLFLNGGKRRQQLDHTDG